jgi:hypothetical protein
MVEELEKVSVFAQALDFVEHVLYPGSDGDGPP